MFNGEGTKPTLGGLIALEREGWRRGEVMVMAGWRQRWKVEALSAVRLEMAGGRIDEAAGKAALAAPKLTKLAVQV